MRSKRFTGRNSRWKGKVKLVSNHQTAEVKITLD